MNIRTMAKIKRHINHFFRSEWFISTVILIVIVFGLFMLLYIVNYLIRLTMHRVRPSYLKLVD